MARGQLIPVTPEVLTWAIDESGYSREYLAEAIGVELRDLLSWESGEAEPTLTRARQLAAKLHRTLAFLLLPNAPEGEAVSIKFRHLPGATSRAQLSPVERRFVRRAQRLQSAIGWIRRESELRPVPLDAISLNEAPEGIAAAFRDRLGVGIDQQLKWPSASAAFDRWRSALEDTFGICVFLFSMGTDSCRGFSLSDEWCPVIAVNTAWNEEARTFTLFHEAGHLLTQTESACAPGVGSAPVKGSMWDVPERWCEQFSAGVLVPSSVVLRLASNAPVADVQAITAIARKLKVSLRATTIRLIELGLATWELYDQLPGATDSKPKGGGGAGRDRIEARQDQLGPMATRVFVEAVSRDLISRTDALSYLNITDFDFDELSRR